MSELAVSSSEIKKLSDKGFEILVKKAFRLQQADLKENQLLYYQAVSPQSKRIHYSKAKTIAVFGGNRSSKTETALVKVISRATGIIPYSISDIDLTEYKGPAHIRVVVESDTTVLYPIILPKLQWWHWTGISSPGGPKGHWGWIPRTSLIDCDWEKSWTMKLKLLRVMYTDPVDPSRNGISTIQFMSKNQDPSDFASGEFDIVLHDEPPSLAIWTENEARAMSVNGLMMLAMTWPDEPTIPVEWIYDKIYDCRDDPSIDVFELYTRDNPNLDQAAIARQASRWSTEMQNVRLLGQPLRFSHLIHPTFTDQSQWWCFICGKTTFPTGGKCRCGSEDIIEFNHVRGFEAQIWPTLYALDPHPRKPHMYLWVQVDPFDDLWVIAEGECDGDPVQTRIDADRVESSLRLRVIKRMMDPKMGKQPSSAVRGVTWKDEFDKALLYCQDADNSDVGRSRVNQYLMPDRHRLQPRLHIHPRCHRTIFQLKRYVWDDHRRSQEKELKQKAKPKYDDYPTLLRYIANDEPSYRSLNTGPVRLQRLANRRY